MAESNRRREKQISYNMKQHQLPRQAFKSGRSILSGEALHGSGTSYPAVGGGYGLAADAGAVYVTEADLRKAVEEVRGRMEAAARELDFIAAAKFRDEMYALQAKLKEYAKA